MIEYADTDASKVIQKAIDALPNGGKIFIKSGVYEIANPIMPKSNIVIEGEGAGTILKIVDKGQTYKMAIRSAGYWVENFCLRNIVIDGNKFALSFDGVVDHYAGVYFETLRFSTIENVEIKNVLTGFALKIANRDSLNNKIINNYIHDCGTDSLNCDGMYVSGDAIIKGNIIENCLDVAILNFWHYNGAVIAENIIKRPRFWGIEIGDGGKNVVIYGNVIDGDNYARHGIRVQRWPNQPSKLVIVGNYIKNVERGMWIEWCDFTTIEGNVIENVSYMGITLAYSNFCVVNGNVIKGAGIYGTELYSVKFSVVKGNVITETNNDGIRLDSDGSTPSDSNIIIGNIVRNCRGLGVNEVGICNNNLIIANDLRGNQGGALSKVGWLTVVKYNLGYDSENFKAVNFPVTVGTNGVYSGPTTIATPSGRVVLPKVKITWSGTFSTGETVTVKVEAVYTDGSTTYVEKSATATGSLWLTDDDVMTLVAHGKDIVKLNIYAKTNLSTTSVTVTVDAYGNG
jgi:parallel beta-helix repeat protein